MAEVSSGGQARGLSEELHLKEVPQQNGWNRCLGTLGQWAPRMCCPAPRVWRGHRQIWLELGSSLNLSTRQLCTSGAAPTPWPSSVPPLPPFKSCSEMCRTMQLPVKNLPSTASTTLSDCLPLETNHHTVQLLPRQLPILKSRLHIKACDAWPPACLELLYGLISSNRMITKASSVF